MLTPLVTKYRLKRQGEMYHKTILHQMQQSSANFLLFCLSCLFIIFSVSFSLLFVMLLPLVSLFPFLFWFKKHPIC